MMSMKDLVCETVLHHEFRSYGKELIVDTCKMDGYYETMVMYPDGNEFECVRNSELDKALEDHTRLHDKYRHHDWLLEAAKLSGKYAKLREAFEKAYVAAAFHQDDDDGGTCNFDRMWLHLQSYEEMRVVAAAKQAGLRAFKGTFLHKKCLLRGAAVWWAGLSPDASGRSDVRSNEDSRLHCRDVLPD